MPREIPLATPGEILNEEWLKPLGISQYALAKAIRVSPRRINQIVHGKRAITADTALRLAAFFGTDAQSWLNLQTHYDIEMERDILADMLAQISRCLASPQRAHACRKAQHPPALHCRGVVLAAVRLKAQCPRMPPLRPNAAFAFDGDLPVRP